MKYKIKSIGNEEIKYLAWVIGFFYDRGVTEAIVLREDGTLTTISINYLVLEV